MNVSYKSLARDSTVVFLGQLVTSATAFGALWAITYFVSKEVVGEYRFVLSVLAILSVVTLPGLDTALVQSTARGYTGQLTCAWKTKLRFGLLGSIASFGIALYYLLQGDPNLTVLFGLGAFILPFYGTFFVYFFYLQGKRLFAKAAIIQAVARVGFLIAMAATAYFVPQSLYLVLAFGFSTIVGQWLGFLYIQKKYPQEDNKDENLVVYGKHLTFLGGWNIVATNIDKVLVWYLLGPVPTAVYTVATLLPLESIRVGRILSQVVLPRFSQSNAVPQFWWLLKKLLLLELLLFTGWLVYAVCSPYFYALLFPSYTEVVSYTIIAMLVVLSSPAYVLRSLFTAVKYKKGLNVALLLNPIVKTVFLGYGLYYYGLLGGVWAFALAGVFELAVFILLFYVMKKPLI